MRRPGPPGAPWVHAAKVASAATAIVAGVALLAAVLINAAIVHRLVADVDGRLSERLTFVTHAPEVLDPPAAGIHLPRASEGDVDDAPTFIWQVSPSGAVTPLSAAAPTLPAHAWQAGPATLTVAGSDFRLAATRVRGSWVVAGESIARIGQARDDLILVELVLGALLIVVTFTGSFLVGLRASAPIEQIRRRQAEFTADASHELRTPLSVIEAEVDLALTRPRPEGEYRATLRRISSESGRLRSIVEDLLWLAREDGRPPDTERPGTVDLDEVAEACTSRFVAVADTAGVTLTTQLSPTDTAWVRGDAEGMDRLLGVLVDNACRHAGRGGSVGVQVAVTGGRVVLTVDDSGPGIPEDHRDLVFDRFHRADDSPGGSGLGLAIADAVVRASSGTWAVGRSPQGGARFSVAWRQAGAPGPPPRPEGGTRTSDREPDREADREADWEPRGRPTDAASPTNGSPAHHDSPL